MNKSVIKFLLFVVIVGFIAYFVSTNFVQIVCVSGDSMLPTYKNDEVLIINKKYKTIEREDVVVAKKNGVTMVKRVVAIENDRIIIKDGKLYINDELYDKYDTIDYAGLASEEIVLGKDEYFVLGDNINKSIDSRFKEIGILNKSDIIGKV